MNNSKITPRLLRQPCEASTPFAIYREPVERLTGFKYHWTRLIKLSAMTLSLTGCMVGPDYQKPETPLPASWSTDLNAGSAVSSNESNRLDRWWKVFNDAILSGLMERAKTNNLDLKQAEARVREARAQRSLAKADLFPTISAAGTVSQQHSSTQTGTGITQEFYSNSFDASWELDIFGKKRRTIEAAEATLQASQEDLRDVLVSLLAEVGLNYVEIRGYQLRIVITETNLATQIETYDITRWRYEAGLTTQLDVDQAKLNMETTRALLPTLQVGLEQAKNRLAVLLGQPPETLQELLVFTKPIPVTSQSVAVGIPADLLRRRPDVRRSERQLAAQTAQIGVAKAARYPNLNLTGSIGLESLLAANLYTAGAKAFQIAAASAWTLFDAGRIRSNIEIETAQQEQALSLYEATILAALRDVENALIAYDQQQLRSNSLKDAVEAAQSALELAQAQYQSGINDFQRVLDTQRSLLSAQLQLAISDAEVAANLIRLYKALGGGWTADIPPATRELNKNTP
ncbi:MAG: efflux transporter outer membrane subunit [Methylococcaceae bacterium]